MSLFGGYYQISGLTFFLFTLFIIVSVGYALGGIKIKGVSLGTAGVFIISLVFGMIFYDSVETSYASAKAAYSIVQNIGLLLFVTSVGFIAGPNFFSGLKKNFKSYILLGLVIILSSGVVTGLIMWATGMNSAMGTGLLSGALTSTPAFSASLASLPAEFQAECTAGHGIAYLFGVVGVVLFVQLVPKFMKADMGAERQKIMVETLKASEQTQKKLFKLDDFGLFGFGLAVIAGVIVGMIKIPIGKGSFSLGTTGGPLIIALIFGHFRKFGKLKIMPEEHTLKVFRELGLMLFLIGAGVPGGASFLKYVTAMNFIYGAIMTLVPMIIGFIVAKFLLKMPLLNNLGSITGGMTSTPALGTLISVSGTEDVANAYAATYPIALVSVVIVSQVLILIFPVV